MTAFTSYCRYNIRTAGIVSEDIFFNENPERIVDKLTQKICEGIFREKQNWDSIPGNFSMKGKSVVMHAQLYNCTHPVISFDYPIARYAGVLEEDKAMDKYCVGSFYMKKSGVDGDLYQAGDCELVQKLGGFAEAYETGEELPDYAAIPRRFYRWYESNGGESTKDIGDTRYYFYIPRGLDDFIRHALTK